MKAKTLMNKIIIVGGLSACLLLGGCGAGQVADATSAESTVAALESTVTPTESTEATETVSTETAQDEAQLPDGVYTAEFSTDSSMFHVSSRMLPAVRCLSKQSLSFQPYWHYPPQPHSPA